MVTPAGQLVAPAEAARHLGVCTATIRRRIADGSLNGYRLGKRMIRVDLAEVTDLLRPIPSVKGDAA